MKTLDAILEAPQPVITTGAQQGAYLAGLVAVVNGKLVRLSGAAINGHIGVAAHGASSTLGGEYSLVFSKRNAIEPLKNAVTTFAVSVFGHPCSDTSPAAFTAKRISAFVFTLSVSMPAKLINWFRLFANNAGFLGKVATRFAVAMSPLFQAGEFARRLVLFAAVALEGWKRRVEKIGLHDCVSFIRGLTRQGREETTLDYLASAAG